MVVSYNIELSNFVYLLDRDESKGRTHQAVKQRRSYDFTLKLVPKLCIPPNTTATTQRTRMTRQQQLDFTVHLTYQ